MLPRLSCPPLPCGPPGLQALAWHGLASTCFAGELPGGGEPPGLAPLGWGWGWGWGWGSLREANVELPWSGAVHTVALVPCLLASLSPGCYWKMDEPFGRFQQGDFFFDIGGYP